MWYGNGKNKMFPNTLWHSGIKNLSEKILKEFYPWH